MTEQAEGMGVEGHTFLISVTMTPVPDNPNGWMVIVTTHVHVVVGACSGRILFLQRLRRELDSRDSQSVPLSH
jgi:hypothetical protein